MEWLSGLWTGFAHALKTEAWAATWIGAIGAFVAIPVTWLVAVTTTQRGIRAAFERDFLERLHQRQRVDAVVTECRKHLATQILLCAGRLQDSADRLCDQAQANVEEVFAVLSATEYYRDRVRRLNVQDLHLGAGTPLIEAAIDDVVWILSRLEIEILAIVNGSSYGQLRKTYDGHTPLFHIGRFAAQNARQLLEVLGHTVDHLGPDGEIWEEENRALLDLAIKASMAPAPELPFVKIKAMTQLPERLIVVPEASHPFWRGG